VFYLLFVVFYVSLHRQLSKFRPKKSFKEKRSHKNADGSARKRARFALNALIYDTFKELSSAPNIDELT
jgi:hypothetical protein